MPHSSDELVIEASHSRRTKHRHRDRSRHREEPHHDSDYRRQSWRDHFSHVRPRWESGRSNNPFRRILGQSDDYGDDERERRRHRYTASSPPESEERRSMQQEPDESTGSSHRKRYDREPRRYYGTRRGDDRSESGGVTDEGRHRARRLLEWRREDAKYGAHPDDALDDDNRGNERPSDRDRGRSPGWGFDRHRDGSRR